jgi:hypothetical protein
MANGRVPAQAYASAETGSLGGGAIRGAIRGVVRNGGAPVPNAVITLIDVRGHQIARSTTGPDGRYVLTAPGSGTYVLIAAAGDHEPQAATLVVGGQPVDFDVTLNGSGGLAGFVRGVDGTPVEGAMAVLTDPRGEVVAGGTTDAGGRFLFPGVAAGDYTLAVSAAGYRPAAIPVEVGGGQTRQEVELRPGVRVHGTIRAEGRGPIADARVTLLDAAGNVVGVATTGPDGEYAFGGLPEGRYTVTATGYPLVASGVDLNGKDDDAHDLWLGHPAE